MVRRHSLSFSNYLLNCVLSSDDAPQFTDPFSARSPSLTSLNTTFTSNKRIGHAKRSASKDKLSKRALSSRHGHVEEDYHTSSGLTAQQAAAGATGFTLDTNLDEMEGIVSQDTLLSGATTMGYLNDRASGHRPSTPDSYTAAVLARRRGSLAPSSHGTTRDSRKDSDRGLDDDGSAPGSPQRENTSRRTSLATDASSLWQSGFNFASPGTNGSQQNPGIGIIVDDSRPPSNGPPTPNSLQRTSTGLQNAAAANSAARAAQAQHQLALQQSKLLDAKNSEAGWTAPESWAVEEMSRGGEDADGSDEDAQALAAPLIASGLSPLLSGGEDGRRDSSGARRLSLITGRPGTSGSMGGSSGMKGPNVRVVPFSVPVCSTLKQISLYQYAVRVFKPDNTFTTLMIPASVPVSDIILTVSRKPGFVNQPGRHLLYIREKGGGK